MKNLPDLYAVFLLNNQPTRGTATKTLRQSQFLVFLYLTSIRRGDKIFKSFTVRRIKLIKYFTAFANLHSVVYFEMG